MPDTPIVATVRIVDRGGNVSVRYQQNGVERELKTAPAWATGLAEIARTIAVTGLDNAYSFVAPEASSAAEIADQGDYRHTDHAKAIAHTLQQIVEMQQERHRRFAPQGGYHGVPGA